MNELKLAALVRDIGKVAPQVGKEFTEQQAAFKAQLEAEEKLLGSVVEMATPALPAISNGIPSCRVDGVLLLDRKAQNDHPLRVYLLTDGTFWETWETYDEGFDTFMEKGKERSLEFIVRKYDVPPMIAALHSALMSQVGKRQPSTAEAKEGAAKLNAILTLLDVPPSNVISLPAAEAEAAAEDIPF